MFPKTEPATMSREAPPPRRARNSRSLTDALDDFAAEKESASRSRRPSNTANTGVFILVAVVGVAALAGGGYFLMAHGNIDLGAPPTSEGEEEKPKIGYISMDEIKAAAHKRAEENGAKIPRSSVRKDAPRANVKDGGFEVLDGVQAKVVGVSIEREYRVGALIYRRRNPLLRITVAFQMSALGQTRSYDYEKDMFPLAKMIDDADRPYPQLDSGFTGRFTSTLRFDKPEIFAIYFDPPAKTRPLYLDIKHPATEPGHVFRFYIPDDAYNVNR
jgi:hypothetical protein